MSSLILPASAAAAETATLAWSFQFPSIDDGVLDFATYRGGVLLVVNTASFCGFTYQYEALEALHAKLHRSGLTVVGIPSQDFNQEKGSNKEVKQFCELTYDVTFPMAGLSHVRGPEAAPFYAWVRATKHWEPQWNFHKVLIARDGTIAGLFGSNDEPSGPSITAALDRALATTS